MPEVNIYAYSLETVVAEKFQTMIDRGVLNSRMKDFYDVYTIIQSDKLDKDILASAICEVFRNRVTEYYEGHPLFNGELKNDSNKQMQWKSFLKKIKYQENLSFEMVVDTIINFLDPYWILLKNN
jgi:predicted nucleotidyltransferase component of viral defense system